MSSTNDYQIAKKTIAFVVGFSCLAGLYNCATTTPEERESYHQEMIEKCKERTISLYKPWRDPCYGYK